MSDIISQLIILGIFGTGWFGSSLSEAGARKAAAHFVTNSKFEDEAKKAASSLSRSLLSIFTFVPIVSVTALEGALSSSRSTLLGYYSIFSTVVSIIFLLLFLKFLLPRDIYEVSSTKLRSLWGKNRLLKYTPEKIFNLFSFFLSVIALIKLIINILLV